MSTIYETDSLGQQQKESPKTMWMQSFLDLKAMNNNDTTIQEWNDKAYDAMLLHDLRDMSPMGFMVDYRLPGTHRVISRNLYNRFDRFMAKFDPELKSMHERMTRNIGRMLQFGLSQATWKYQWTKAFTNSTMNRLIDEAIDALNDIYDHDLPEEFSTALKTELARIITKDNT